MTVNKAISHCEFRSQSWPEAATTARYARSARLEAIFDVLSTALLDLLLVRARGLARLGRSATALAKELTRPTRSHLERDREHGLRPETLEFAAYHERPATSPREDRAAGSAARARSSRRHIFSQ